MTPDTSGRLFELPLLTWDPASSCWRTSGAISRSGSTGSSVTLPTSGMTRSGELFEHPTWAAATRGPGCSLLPTPTASERDRTPEEAEARHRQGRALGRNGGGRPDLTSVAVLLPTPTARDWKGHNQRHDATCLPGALLPTPRTSDANGTGEHGTGGPDLRTAVDRLLPTPTTQAAKHGTPTDYEIERYRQGGPDAFDLWVVAAMLPALVPTPLPSTDGKPTTDPHPTPPPTGDSTPGSSNG